MLEEIFFCFITYITYIILRFSVIIYSPLQYNDFSLIETNQQTLGCIEALALYTWYFSGYSELRYSLVDAYILLPRKLWINKLPIVFSTSVQANQYPTKLPSKRVRVRNKRIFLSNYQRFRKQQLNCAPESASYLSYPNNIDLHIWLSYQSSKNIYLELYALNQ